MLIAILIGVMVSIIVGVALIPMVMDVTEEAKTVSPEVAAGATGALLDILPYIFVAILIIGAVAWLAHSGAIGRTGRRVEWFGWKNPTKLFQEADKFCEKLGGFQTAMKELTLSISVDADLDSSEPLTLDERHNRIELHDQFEWYVVEKHSTHLMYKVVGLDKRGRRFNTNYILGRDSHTNVPYLLRLPPNYLMKSLKDSIDWCVRARKGDTLVEV